MECNGKDAAGDEHCKENCTCVPDTMRNRTSGHRRISHPKPQFALAQFSENRLKKLKDVLAGWMKMRPKGGKSERNNLNNVRAQFVEKMLNSYEHLRQKATELRALQREQEDLKKQQEMLQKTIKTQGNRLKKAKKLKDSRNGYYSKVKIGRKSARSRGVTKYLSKIKEQLTTLQKQQEWLQREQEVLFYNLGHGMVMPEGYRSDASLMDSQELQNGQLSYNSAARSIKSEDNEDPSQMLYSIKEDPDEDSLGDENDDGEQEYAVVEKKTLHFGSGRNPTRLGNE